jgi:uncharacterized protein YndB with AHSA1/START domain
MPVKKDGRGKHWVEMETLIPGTPEQVWQAMCTGPGMSTWFMPAKVDEQVGGKLSFDMGGGSTSAGLVTAWEPPKLFGYVERDWMPGAPPVATELTITARGDGKCTVRMVHSLFASSDDWDDQLESFESGWPGFFEVLKLYLTHFTGRSAAPFNVMKPAKDDALAVWKRMVAAVGVAGADVGERRKTSAEPVPLEGVVELVRQDDRFRYIVLRISAPFDGITIFGTYVNPDGSTSASAWTWVYGDDAASVVTAHEPKWRKFVESIAG